MYSLLYTSTAAIDFTPAALLHLLNQARRNNARAALTGMLVYHDGAFMQVLEGEEAALKLLHDRLLIDPRHRKMVVLSEGPLSQRNFPDWSMGFRDLRDFSGSEAAGLLSFEELSLQAETFAGKADRALRLLRTFAEV